MSRRWPPLVRLAMKRQRRPNQSSNRRMKWEFQCQGCQRWFPGKLVEVDHIEPCGSLKSFEDLPGFASRLFCEVDGLQVLCDCCHSEKHSEVQQ